MLERKKYIWTPFAKQNGRVVVTQMKDKKSNSHSRGPDLIYNSLSLRPLIYVALRLPARQLVRNAVYQFLFSAGLGQGDKTLFIQPVHDVF